MKILAVGAHYDDVEIGCGGTLIKHVCLGHEVLLAIIRSDEYRTGDPIMRYEEQLTASALMGNPSVLKFYKSQTIDKIIACLDALDVDIVFTHYEFDTHQDHRKSSIIGQSVGRKRKITTVFYDSGSTYDFNPNIFSIIDYKKKVKLLECYKSQIKVQAISLDILERKNNYLASLITSRKDVYAEGFVVRKMKWLV